MGTTVQCNVEYGHNHYKCIGSHISISFQKKGDRREKEGERGGTETHEHRKTQRNLQRHKWKTQRERQRQRDTERYR